MKWLFGTRTPLIVINHGLVSWFINPGLTFMVVNGGYSCRNSFFDGIHMNPANFDILHALRGFAREAPIQPYPVFWIRRTLRWTRNLDMFHCVFKALRWFFFGFNSIFGFPVPEIWWLSQFSSSVEALETSSWWLQIPEIPWRKADRRSRSTQIDVPIFSETDLRCRCKFMSKCSQHGTYWDILGHFLAISGNSWMMIWAIWQFLDDDMEPENDVTSQFKIWGHLTPKRQQFCTLLASMWFPCVLHVQDFFSQYVKVSHRPLEIQKFELPDALRLCCHSLILTPRSSVFGKLLVKHGETRWWNYRA